MAIQTWYSSLSKLPTVLNESLGIGATGFIPPTLLTIVDTIITSPRGIMSWQVSNSADGARFHLRKDRGTTIGVPAAVLTGDMLGRIVASGYVGATNKYIEMASIDFNATGTVADTSTGRLPTQIIFKTATDASPSVLTTALTINEKQQTLLPSGSATVPALAFSAASQVGFYYDGSYGLCTASAGSMRISLAGSDIYAWGNASVIYFGASADLRLTRAGAATLQIGNNVNGSPVHQTFKAANGITGTDVAGANLTIQSGLGTGAGAPGNLIFQTATAIGTGTTAQTYTTRLTIAPTGATFTGNVDAATFSAGSTAGADGGPFTLITAITVKKGIVTAITGS